MSTHYPTWEETFFDNCPPTFDVTKLIHNPSSFRCFPYSARKWTFGMEVHERKVVISSKQKPLNLVLWLFAPKAKDNKVTYVAKAVSH